MYNYQGVQEKSHFQCKGGDKMSIFAMLDIWGWIKPYLELELCDLPEN